jgi:hypothetical protein
MVFIKNEGFKCQPSTPMLAFASMRSSPFIEIDDKGGEIVQRYERFGKDYGLDMENGQRGSNIEEYEGIKILG